MHGAEAEKRRLQLLHEYAVLDTPEEPQFQSIVRTAAARMRTPIAVVSLIDENRQWFKARVGLDETETPRSVAFCHHTIRGEDVLEVGDASADARFADNPLVVGEPHIRFYAGAPLIAEAGLALGTLCVIDRQPRPPLTPEERGFLTALARRTVASFRLRRDVARHEAGRRELLGLLLEKDRLSTI